MIHSSPVRINEQPLRLRLSSPLPSLFAVLLAGMLYILGAGIFRMVTDQMSPEDWRGLAFVMALLAGAAVSSFNRLTLVLDRQADVCWLLRHRLGFRTSRRIPLACVHSMRSDTVRPGGPEKSELGSLMLVTAMGVIPVSRRLEPDLQALHQVSARTNQFLQQTSTLLAA